MYWAGPLYYLDEQEYWSTILYMRTAVYTVQEYCTNYVNCSVIAESNMCPCYEATWGLGATGLKNL